MGMEWLYHSKTGALPLDGPTWWRWSTTGGICMCGIYDAEHHREAITSRPALLGGVARMTRHSGQSTIKVSLQHDKKELLVEAIKLVSKTLCRFYLIAEQWSIEQRWTLLLTHIFRHWLGGKRLGALPEGAQALLSG
jgi:hypothetical protein